MERKHRIVSEVELIVIDRDVRLHRSEFISTLELLLEERNCGRVLGSGRSIVCDESLVVEIGAYDKSATESAIETACANANVADHYTSWD